MTIAVHERPPSSHDDILGELPVEEPRPELPKAIALGRTSRGQLPSAPPGEAATKPADDREPSVLK